MNKLLLVLASAGFFIASAQAQNSGTVSNHAVPIGKGPGVTGFGSLTLGNGQIPVGQTSADPQAKTLSGDVTMDNAGVTSIGAKKVTNSKINPGSANTTKGSLDGLTESDIAIASCSAIYQFTQWVSGTGWQCGLIPVLPSRAVAATLNLSAFSAVQTQGYATPGDGGGATFKKVGAGSAFTDSYISGSPTLAGGSSYTNGTYLGVPLTGGVGSNCNGAVTVSGNAVTAVSVVIPCPGYKVGDVLTTPNTYIGGTGSGFTWTITSVSTAQASFTDSSGNLWQYVSGEAGVVNALQFGCKGDWTGTDGTATNNSNCLWSAAAFSNFPNGGTSVAGQGNQILIPHGNYMTCGAFNGSAYALPVPQSVRFSGVSIFGTTLTQCLADGSGLHYVQLCDSNALVGQFGCKVENMRIYTLQITGSTANIAAIYSNSGQQFALAENVEVQAGNKSCIKYEIGKGGAANDIWIGVDCVQSGTSTNPGYSFNASGTQHILQRSVAASTGGSALAISNLNGRLLVDGIDVEGYVTGLSQNVSTSGNISSYKNVQQNSNNCTQAILLQGTNTAGNILFENVATGCPTTITNGQAGGSNFTGNIVKQITCVSGACS